MRKPRIPLVLLSLVLPALLLGCEGDTGPQGAQGPEGPQGPPGTTTVVLANETCVLCHGEGKIVDVDVIHEEETEELKENSQITISNLDMSFTPNADNVTATVTFTSTGADLSTINTSRPNPDRLAWLRLQFALLDTRPDGTTYWYSYTGSQRNPENLLKVGDDYTYEFDIPASGFDNVNVSLAKFSDNTRHRVGVIIYTANSLQPLPGGVSVNAFADVTGDGAPPAVSRDIVRTENCEECHNRLGAAPYKFVLVDEDIPGVYGEPEAFHGGARYRTEICVTCHDVDFRDGVGTFEVLIHKIHAFEGEEYILSEPFIFGEGDYSKLSFPQDARNCTKCHRGGVDSGNWKSVPTIAACGACHDEVNFTTGENHLGGPQPNNASCTLCHAADVDGFAPGVSIAHRTENVTPNNPQLPAGLSRFEYFLDNVAVDNTGLTTVGFRITQDGVPLDLSTGVWPPPSNTATPIDNTSGPSFLLAWALPQDGIDTPAEYNNLNSPDPPSTSNGNGAGDAPSVSLRDLVQNNLVTASGAGYTATLDGRVTSDWTAPGFPQGATMRAVALQSYFSQVTSPTTTVGRHTPSVVLDVDPNDARRQVVKSGYTGDPAAGGQPFGCLECHETLELHGGSRVNNVRVCVFCHNPNKSSSGRTANPADPSCSEAERCDPEVDPFLVLGPDPLQWPEATNNFKNMIHGIHASTDRPFEFVRNRLNGIYYNWSFVTFPGILSDCEKCHIGDSYVPSNVPANTLWNVERITTGNPAETREDIISARGSVPNPTDLVDSPIAGACFYCHDEGLAKSHILTQGGKLSIWPSVDTGSGAISREDASELP